MGRHERKDTKGSTSGSSVRKQQRDAAAKTNDEFLEQLDQAIKDNHDFPPQSGKLK